MNSTILAWQFAGHNIFEWLFWTLATIVAILYMVLRSNAKHNTRNLRTPDYTVGSILSLSADEWRSFWNQGVRVIVPDVDLTLCGMHEDHLSEEVRLTIKMCQKMGFKFILASKSSTPRPNIYNELDGDGSWLQVWTSAKKHDITFLRGIKSMIRLAGWTLGPNYKILVIGDKLTDMGYSSVDENHGVITILANPQFGKDLPGEALVLRRHFENITLQTMGVKRCPEGLYAFRKT